MSKAQRWAQQRNFAKRRLRGVSAHLVNLTAGWGGETLGHWEKERLKLALAHIGTVIIGWDENNEISKETFLK